MKLTTAAILPLLTIITAAIPTLNTTLFEEVALIPADSVNSTSSSSLQAAEAVSKRNTGWAGVYYCRNTNWQGPCAHTWLKINQCMNFPNGWDNHIQSFGPDAGPHYCVLHSQPNCGGGEPKFRIRHPGSRNTEEYGQNKRASSVRCNY